MRGKEDLGAALQSCLFWDWLLFSTSTVALPSHQPHLPDWQTLEIRGQDVPTLGLQSRQRCH